MKNRTSILAFVVCLFSGAAVFGQAFQKTISVPGVDFNHYSIETIYTGAGGYICAGTQFEPSGNQNMHILRLDPVGNIVWEYILDETQDDRALDLAVDQVTNNGIVVTGYITPGASNEPELYVVNLDLGGNFIADQRLTGYTASVGTNVVYSWVTRTWTVGGFHSDPINGYPLTSNEAILVEFDLGMNIVNSRRISGFNTNHSSINDIVEIPGDGYFITGSVGVTNGFPNYASQGVLALKIDYAYNTLADVSFESVSTEHYGSSVVFDSINDQVCLMSNSSLIHNPQIAVIDNISGTPTISASYRLELDPTWGSRNASGFQLRQSPWSQSSLIASGYFQFYTDGSTNFNAIPWITEFDKATGTPISVFTWPAPSPNFQAHGGGVLSTWSGVQPYIFNQEILTERVDGIGMTLIGPRTVAGNYGIDVVTVHQAWGMPCYSPYSYVANTQAYVGIPGIVSNPGSLSGSPLNGSLKNISVSTVGVNCATMLGSSSPLIDEGVESNDAEFGTTAGIIGEEAAESFEVYPNPFNDGFQIQLEGNDLSGRITVMNAMGQTVFRSGVISGNSFSTNVSSENFSTGVYIVTYTNANGITKTEKVVKL